MVVPAVIPAPDVIVLALSNFFPCFDNASGPSSTNFFANLTKFFLKLFTLFLIKFKAPVNGLASKAENANLTAKPAIEPTDVTRAPTPTTIVVAIAAKIPISLKNFSLNFFSSSILPSDCNLRNDKDLSVNHPLANMNKNSASLPNIPCVFAATLLTGDNNAFCIFLSKSDSFPSLSPCSANVASLFCLAASLCLSNWSLISKFDFKTPRELFNVDTCSDIFVSCTATPDIASEF